MLNGVRSFFFFYFIFVLFELLLHLEGRNTHKKDRFKRIDSIDRPEGDDIKGILFKLVHHGIVIWNTLKRDKKICLFFLRGTLAEKKRRFAGEIIPGDVRKAQIYTHIAAGAIRYSYRHPEQ